jgi:hypothetical protein
MKILTCINTGRTLHKTNQTIQNRIFGTSKYPLEITIRSRTVRNGSMKTLHPKLRKERGTRLFQQNLKEAKKTQYLLRVIRSQ